MPVEGIGLFVRMPANAERRSNSGKPFGFAESLWYFDESVKALRRGGRPAL